MSRKQKLMASALASLGNTQDELLGPGNTRIAFEEVRLERIPVDEIDSNPWQPRKKIGDIEIEDLAKSIAETGQIEPIIVRKRGERYQLIAGERRLLAHKFLERSHIDALIREVEDSQVALLALVENMQRSDLSDYEIGAAIAAAEKQFRFKKEIGATLGIGRTDLYRYLAFGELPEWLLAELDESPKLISKRLAEALRNFLKGKDASDYKESILKGLRALENGRLNNNNFISAISKKAPIQTRDRDFTESTFTQGDTLVGKIKYQPGKRLTLKLDGSILSDENFKAIEGFIREMIERHSHP